MTDTRRRSRSQTKIRNFVTVVNLILTMVGEGYDCRKRTLSRVEGKQLSIKYDLLKFHYGILSFGRALNSARLKSKRF